MKDYSEHLNKKYNRLLILEYLGFEERVCKLIYKYKMLIFKVQCDCGVTKSIKTRSISALPQSCGCLYKETRLTASKSYLPKGEHAFNSLFSSYRIRAKNKSISFDISKEQFRAITSSNCYYCGIEPNQIFGNDCKTFAKDRQSYRIKSYNGQYIYNGIDRINSDLGYQDNNIRACCGFCNKAKLDHTEQEFEDWLKRIIAYRGKKDDNS